MKRLFPALLLALGLILALGINDGISRAADPPPRASTQPQEDTFQYNGQSLDIYNPHSGPLRAIGDWRYRFGRNPACVGDIFPALRQAMDDLTANFAIRFIEDNLNGNLMYANCGPAFRALVGGGIIACLCRGYPGNVTIDFSTDMADFFEVSQLSIALHELFHGMATWHEQYTLGTFAPSQDVTVMNTGPLSRHRIGQSERERWWRTMGSPELKELGYAYSGAWYVWACQFDAKATRLSVLVDRHDGRGIVWTGVASLIIKNSQGCMGIGIEQDLDIAIGAEYYLKQENPSSWRVSLNEARVPY